MKRGLTCSHRRGQTLVSLLIVVVILLAVGAFIFYFSQTDKKPGKPPPEAIPKAALERAHDVECQNNLRQLRAALQMAQAEETLPPDLSSLNLGETFLKCPVGGEPYRYDPQTGQVSCVHPGHGNF